MQAEPVDPQALMLMPLWHWPLASQQPAQFEALHGALLAPQERRKRTRTGSERAMASP
jgi:hypothetical protein